MRSHTSGAESWVSRKFLSLREGCRNVIGHFLAIPYVGSSVSLLLGVTSRPSRLTARLGAI